MKIKSELAQPSVAEAAAEDHELTEAEIESFSRDSVLAGEEASDPDQYLRMWNVSAGFFNERVVRAHQPQPVEISIHRAPATPSKATAATVDPQRTTVVIWWFESKHKQMEPIE